MMDLGRLYRRNQRIYRIKVFMLVTAYLAVMIILALNAKNCFAGDASFSWLPNSETDLAGYKIHYGPAAGEYTEVKDCALPDIVDGRVPCAIETVPDGTTYFAATAYDKAGQESGYSNEVAYDPPPASPKGVTTITVIVNVSMAR